MLYARVSNGIPSKGETHGRQKSPPFSVACGLRSRSAESLVALTRARSRKRQTRESQWNGTNKNGLLNIRQADTDDLLDRITAYRAGLVEEAIDMIEKELHRRDVTAAQIAEHREACRRECVFHQDGTAKMCMFCRKPAVVDSWGWQKLWGLVPLFPRRCVIAKTTSAWASSSPGHRHPPA